MALIKDGALADDPWAPLDDAADLGAAERPIISLERWLGNGAALARYNGPLGIRLKSGLVRPDRRRKLRASPSAMPGPSVGT